MVNKFWYVLSDSHSRMDLVDRVFEKITESAVVIHCGDFDSEEALLTIKSLCEDKGITLLGVPGNCDRYESLAYLNQFSGKESPFSVVRSDEGYCLKLDYDGFRIGVYHSHLPYSLGTCDVMFYGHTHVKKVEEIGDVVHVNPGALHKVEQATFLRIDINDLRANRFDESIYHYMEV